jgi:hypothetical protein
MIRECSENPQQEWSVRTGWKRTSIFHLRRRTKVPPDVRADEVLVISARFRDEHLARAVHG